VQKNSTIQCTKAQDQKSSKRPRPKKLRRARPLGLRLALIFGALRDVRELLCELEVCFNRGWDSEAEQLAQEISEKVDFAGQKLATLCRHRSERVSATDPHIPREWWEA